MIRTSRRQGAIQMCIATVLATLILTVAINPDTFTAATAAVVAVQTIGYGLLELFWKIEGWRRNRAVRTLAAEQSAHVS